MTAFALSYEETMLDLAGPDDAVAAFDRLLGLYGVHGVRGWAMWFGPGGASREDMPLRVDASLDDSAMCAIRWRPDGAVLGGSGDAGGPRIRVQTSAYAPVSVIPAELVRVSLDEVRAVIAEYVRTGRRPSGEWGRTGVAEYDIRYESRETVAALDVSAAGLAVVERAFWDGEVEDALARLNVRPPDDRDGWRVVMEETDAGVTPRWVRREYFFPETG